MREFQNNRNEGKGEKHGFMASSAVLIRQRLRSRESFGVGSKSDSKRVESRKSQRVGNRLMLKTKKEEEEEEWKEEKTRKRDERYRQWWCFMATFFGWRALVCWSVSFSANNASHLLWCGGAGAGISGRDCIRAFFVRHTRRLRPNGCCC